MSPAATTRWSPTPEQVMILEEMYRAGVRTPSAAHIQHITSHLSLYGPIQGKNVFYWFQNHKARHRQKLRRRLVLQPPPLPLPPPMPLLGLIDRFELEENCNCNGDGYRRQVLAVRDEQLCDCSASGFLRSSTGFLSQARPEGTLPQERMRGAEPGATWPCSATTATRRPLQTLDLFPITATARGKDPHQPNSAFDTDRDAAKELTCNDT